MPLFLRCHLDVAGVWLGGELMYSFVVGFFPLEDFPRCMGFLNFRWVAFKAVLTVTYPVIMSKFDPSQENLT